MPSWHLDYFDQHQEMFGGKKDFKHSFLFLYLFSAEKDLYYCVLGFISVQTGGYPLAGRGLGCSVDGGISCCRASKL